MGDDIRTCKICNKRLRKLTSSTDWENRCYHINCWKEIVKDISQYNKVAYTKYSHKKKINGSNIEDIREKMKADPDYKFIITWD